MSGEKINCDDADQDHGQDLEEEFERPQTVLYCELRNADTAWRVVNKEGYLYRKESIGWYILTFDHGFVFIPHSHEASPPVFVTMDDSDEYFYTAKEAQNYIDNFGDGSASAIAKMNR